MDYKTELEHRIEDRVKDKLTKGVKILFFAIFAIGLFFLAGYVLMLLWNWLMPQLFGVPTVTYWQAVGILILAKMLFGFGGGNGPGKHSKKRVEKTPRNTKNCSLRRDFSEWKHYDDFWKEEGENAFKAYVNRKNQESNEGEKQGD